MEQDKVNNTLAAFDETTLNYKEHHLFFEDYYLLKKEFITKIGECHSDISLIPEAYTKLSSFIISVIAQLQLKVDFTQIQKNKNEVFNLINNKKDPLMIINKMIQVYSDTCKICMDLELEPKPKVIEDSEEVKFWKDEEHRGLREIKKGFADVLSIKNG
jgi:hypothetical protein